MSINEPVDLDAIGQAATALAERNDGADTAKIAASRINQVVEATSNAAMEGVNKQINDLRALGRMIEGRSKALQDAAVEHAQFCQEVCRSNVIMADAVAAHHRAFQNGMPPSLRLVPTEDR